MANRVFNFSEFLFESKVESFGYFSEGSSPILIVAPHAVEEDDANTKEISKKLAKKLNAFVIINDTFHKPCGKKCKYDEDFNRLPPKNKKGIFNWAKRKPQMKDFYEMVSSFAEKAKNRSKDNNKKCLVLFIHGLSHDDYDIDLGAGMRSSANMVINSEQHPKSKKNSGNITAPVSFVESFKSLLEQSGLKVGTGDVFSGWSEQNGVQYLNRTGSESYSIQIELNTNLRNDVDKTVEILSAAIKQLKDFSEPISYNPVK